MKNWISSSNTIHRHFTGTTDAPTEHEDEEEEQEEVEIGHEEEEEEVIPVDVDLNLNDGVGEIANYKDSEEENADYVNVAIDINSTIPNQASNKNTNQSSTTKSPVQVSINLPAGVTATAEVPCTCLPDSAPQKRRRILYYMIIVAVVLSIILITTISTVAAKNKKKKKNSNASNPSGGGGNIVGGGNPGDDATERQYTPDEINTIIALINGHTLSGQTLRYPLAEDATPEALALQWLIEDRSGVFFNVTHPSDQLWMTERYALATLYWYHYNVDDGTHPWVYRMGWLKDLNECDWYGISCTEYELGDPIGTSIVVTSLVLPSNGLNGILPPDIGLLSYLKTFTIGNNAVTGTLPTTIGLWTAMEKFDVTLNYGLVGTIPLSIQSWTNLQSAQLYYTGLAGTMPPGVCLSANDVLPCAVECSCCEGVGCL